MPRCAHLLLESSDSARRSRNRPYGRGSRHLRFGGDGAPLSASAGWWGANGANATLRKEGRENDAGRQDLRSSAKDLEEKQSPGRSGSRTPATAGDRHQTLRRSKASKPTLPVLPPRQSRSQQWNRPRRGGDRGRTARGQRPQRCGTAVIGDSFEGYGSCTAGKRLNALVFDQASSAETRRTPGSAAGCNKPATRSAEETVAVVRNHEGGTGLRRWNLRGRRGGRPPSREWTLNGHVDGGATGTSHGTRAVMCGRNPGEKVERPGRTVKL